MNFLITTLISLFVLLIPFVEGAESPEKLKARGLFIEFSPQADISLRDIINYSMGTKLVYRSKSQSVDVVKPLNEALLNSNERDSLLELCNKYQKKNYVISCEIYLDFPLPEICNPQILNPPNEHINNLENLDNSINDFCYPFEKSEFMPLKQGLSPLWAQQLIGTDLTKEYMDKLNQASPLTETDLGNLDGGFDISKITGKYSDNSKKANGGNYQDHGTKVVNLMNGNGNYSVAYKARLTALADGYSKPYLEAVDEILTQPPSILNYDKVRKQHRLRA